MVGYEKINSNLYSRKRNIKKNKWIIKKKFRKVETEEQLKQYKNSTAKSFASLSIGVFTLSMVGDILLGNILLIVCGVVFALSAVYLRIPCDLKQEWFLKKFATKQNMFILEAMGWFIITIGFFCYGLILMDVLWLKITGILFALVAYIMFLISICRARRIRD